MVTSAKDMQPPATYWHSGEAIERGNKNVTSGISKSKGNHSIMSGKVTGFLSTVNNFISDTYHDLDSSGFPSAIPWQLVNKLVYQVFACDLDKVRSFMRISHGTRDCPTLASRSIWAIICTNMLMKAFQLQELANYPLIVGTYVLFLVANSKIGKANKLEEEIKTLKGSVKLLTAEVKAAKNQASTTVTKVDNAMSKKKE
eukprot:15146701-Ditylum_brightwellii.AAC.1